MKIAARWRALVVASLTGVGAFCAPAEETVIVREPGDVTLEEGQTLRLSVDAVGGNLAYQWYRGTNRLVNYPTRELIWPDIKTDQGGGYYVVISNSFNVVTSRLASVTVLRDIKPPILLSAEEYLSPFSTGPDGVLLTFSEPVARASQDRSASGTNIGNYIVREFGTTNLVTVSNAIPGVGTNVVRLTLGPLKRTASYLVTVTNLVDVRSNYMRGPNIAYVGLYVTNAVVALDSVWAWNESGADLGIPWRERDYDDNQWPRGRGVFAFEFDNLNYCGSGRNTLLSLGPVTYYFRHSFSVQRTTGKALLSWVTETIDDGAIFYLNGQELRRVNMPAGPVTSTTRALAAREGNCSRPFSSTQVTNLVEGTNVLAVEVHQTGNDFDVVFGAEVTAVVMLPYPVQVPLNIARSISGEVVLSWTGHGGELKWASRPLGPWLPLGTNSPISLSADLSASFFRLDPFTE